jgi:pilus assembly protein Flp/PilA
MQDVGVKVVRDRKGAAMIEYALLAALIALALVAALGPLRTQIATVFNNIRVALGGS